MTGSAGEHELQERHGTTRRAQLFYERQVLDRLNEEMRSFIAQMELVFVATSDAQGEADCSLRAGPPGFVHVIDESTLAYPEYRGNGVMASLGNILENRHVGLLFVDFYRHAIGLHVNGSARLVENEQLHAMTARAANLGASDGDGPRPERWVVVGVEEAYVHCSKHIPLLAKQDKTIVWGTDDAARKGGDFFNVGQRVLR